MKYEYNGVRFELSKAYPKFYNKYKVGLIGGLYKWHLRFAINRVPSYNEFQYVVKGKDIDNTSESINEDRLEYLYSKYFSNSRLKSHEEILRERELKKREIRAQDPKYDKMLKAGIIIVIIGLILIVSGILLVKSSDNSSSSDINSTFTYKIDNNNSTETSYKGGDSNEI